MKCSTDTLAIVMAGGVGTRLSPLTLERAKPAVPFGAQYRIIDFTLSNCLHSGLRCILVLTQYKSQSLHQHVQDGWSIFNPQLGEYISVVPPQMRTGDSWYAGTADAIYQNRYLIQRSGAKNVIVLSGDHIYRMDYSAIIRQHEETDADLTIACMEVESEDAKEFGVMSIGKDQRIYEFAEKPPCPKTIPGQPGRALVSMGIYVFSTEMLCDELVNDHGSDGSNHDFGKDLIPRLIHTHRVYGHRFTDACCESEQPYWRDVGTIESYYQANMELLHQRPLFDLHCAHWPIHKCDVPAPPTRICSDEYGETGSVSESILSNGVIVAGGSVERSVLSPGVHVSGEAIVSESILFDGVQIGRGAKVQNCIIDKRVVVPAGETIGVDPTLDARRFTVSPSGVVVVPKEYQFMPEAVPSPHFRRSRTRATEQPVSTNQMDKPIANGPQVASIKESVEAYRRDKV